MAGVNVLIPASTVTRTPHRKVTLTGSGTTVTLDIANPEVDIAGLADEWVETPVPGRKPYLQRGAKRLRTMAIEATMGRSGDDREADVTGPLLNLVTLASPFAADRTVVLGYSRLEAHRELTDTGAWVITDLTIRTIRRRPDGTPVRARVSIELTEASFPLRPATPGSPTIPSAAPAAPGSTPAPAPAAAPSRTSSTARRHTVRQGETLWKIAADHYGGDTSKWSAIAQANGIRDPRRLAVGTVLVLP